MAATAMLDGGAEDLLSDLAAKTPSQSTAPSSAGQNVVHGAVCALIGVVSNNNSKYQVLFAVPTPPEEEDRPTVFSHERVATHVSNLRSSLPGGLDVIGLAVIGQNAQTQAAGDAALAALVGTAVGDDDSLELKQFPGSEYTHRLLLQVPARNRITGRAIPLASSQGSTSRPVTFKSQKGLASRFQTVETDVRVGVQVCLPYSTTVQPLDALNEQLPFLLEPAKASLVTLADGQMLTDSNVKAAAARGALRVRVKLCGLGMFTSSVAPSSPAVTVDVKRGQCHILAVIPPKCTAEQLTQAVKGDIGRTLRARLTALLEACESPLDDGPADDPKEWGSNEGENTTSSKAPPLFTTASLVETSSYLLSNVTFPVRVSCKSSASELPFSEYVVQDEIADASDLAKERLASLGVAVEQTQLLEDPAPLLEDQADEVQMFYDDGVDCVGAEPEFDSAHATAGEGETAAGGGTAAAGGMTLLLVTTALAVVIVAILLALWK